MGAAAPSVPTHPSGCATVLIGMILPITSPLKTLAPYCIRLAHSFHPFVLTFAHSRLNLYILAIITIIS